MKTVTGTAVAWMSPHDNVSLSDLMAGKRIGDLTFTRGIVDMSTAGYVRVGEATISIEMIDENQIVKAQVSSLRDQIAEVNAKAVAMRTSLESRINDLLCISDSSASDWAQS